MCCLFQSTSVWPEILGTANNWRKCESNLEDKDTDSGLLPCQGMEKIRLPVIPTPLLQILPLFIDCSIETNQLQVVLMAFKMGLWANIGNCSLSHHWRSWWQRWRQRIFCWCLGFSAGRAPSWLQVCDCIRDTGQCCQVNQLLYGNVLIIPIGPVPMASVLGRAIVLAGFLLFLTITLAKYPVMTPLYPPGLQRL